MKLLKNSVLKVVGEKGLFRSSSSVWWPRRRNISGIEVSYSLLKPTSQDCKWSGCHPNKVNEEKQEQEGIVIGEEIISCSLGGSIRSSSRSSIGNIIGISSGYRTVPGKLKLTARATRTTSVVGLIANVNHNNNSTSNSGGSVGNFPQAHHTRPITSSRSYFSSLLKSSPASLLSSSVIPPHHRQSSFARFYSSSVTSSSNSPLQSSFLKETKAMTVNNASDPDSRDCPGGALNSSVMKPHGVQHNWDLRTYTPKEIEQKCADIIEQLRKLFDSAASAETVNFDSVLKPLLEAHRYSFTHGAVVTFPRHVADSQAIRDAASQATKLLDESSVEMSMRKDVFDKLVEYRDNYSHLDNLSPEYQRCLDRLIHTGRRNGLHLSEDVREKVKAIKKQVSELTLQFSRNLGEENTVLLFSAEELDGMPPTFLEGLEKDSEGKYKVSLKYPHFFPVTRKCRVPETRKKLEIAYQSKCIKENTRILEEVLELRQREAELLCYANHAAYSQDMQMAKHPDNVKTFLSDLAIKLQPLWKEEKQIMLELKKRECEKYNYEYNDKLEMWDFRYYMCLIEEEKYAVDQQLLMGYFPLEVVTKGMLGIYEDLLGLKFTQLPDAQKWHADVEVYQVNDRNTSELMGYFYLDLFPREGKFGHACCVPLQPGCLNENGIKQPAVSAMLTNFTRPKNNKPSLLDHKEVETYFHEFGHLMHTICSRANSALLFGTRVETDFLEAPSQMLENWVWEREPLRRMSLHYEMKTPLPDDIIDKLAASQVANAGGLNLRQIVLATFDQRVHLQGRSDTQLVYAQTLQEIMGLDAIPGTNMPANFNHLCIGYSGRYYSYLWSEVFSMDMYNTMFKTKGIFNTETGLLYRKCILEPGGSKDAMDMLRNFLGREPNNTAFLESKGLSSDGL